MRKPDNKTLQRERKRESKRKRERENRVKVTWHGISNKVTCNCRSHNYIYFSPLVKLVLLGNSVDEYRPIILEVIKYCSICETSSISNDEIVPSPVIWELVIATMYMKQLLANGIFYTGQSYLTLCVSSGPPPSLI